MDGVRNAPPFWNDARLRVGSPLDDGAAPLGADLFALVIAKAGHQIAILDLEAGHNGEQPAVAPAIRKKKDTGGATVRGLASGEESGRMTEAELSRIIANEIYEVLYGSTD